MVRPPRPTWRTSCRGRAAEAVVEVMAVGQVEMVADAAHVDADADGAEVVVWTTSRRRRTPWPGSRPRLWARLAPGAAPWTMRPRL